MFQKTKIVSNILYINIIVFLFTVFIPGLTGYLSIWPTGSENFHFYQFITSLFTHAGILHIVFNMLALLSFGPICEEDMSERRFLLFYMITGVFASITHMAFTNSPNPSVGASGSIFGLLVYSTLLHPNQKLSILFLPFLSMKGKWFITIILLSEVLFAVLDYKDGISHMAHIGGAMMGALFFLFNRKFQ